MKNFFKSILFLTFFVIYGFNSIAAEKSHELLSPGWSFKGFFGKFDTASLQRGYQVYTEVCSACHCGPEFSDQQAKIIASQFEVTDGPNSEGEMFTRTARLSDKFVGPYANEQAATAANGGAYPPDMSVLVKARQGGADYIYSVLMGYEDPPSEIILDDGVYYNKYMPGNNIKMTKPLSPGAVEYADGTDASEEQMAKDVVAFLAWAAEPHLEARHKIGFRAIIYLFIITVLVYFSMKKLWSRIESKV